MPVIVLRITDHRSRWVTITSDALLEYINDAKASRDFIQQLAHNRCQTSEIKYYGMIFERKKRKENQL